MRLKTYYFLRFKFSKKVLLNNITFQSNKLVFSMFYFAYYDLIILYLNIYLFYKIMNLKISDTYSNIQIYEMV